MRLVLLTLSAVIASIAGAPSDFSLHIAGSSNEVTDIKTASHVAAISNATHTVCSGWIYSPEWIVTAASCLQGKTASTLSVTVGATTFVRPEATAKTYSVVSITSHPDFKSNSFANNIALVKVAPMTLTAGAVDALFYDEEITTPGTPITLTGWGATSEGSEGSLKLRTGVLTVKADGGEGSCDALYPRFGYNKLSMICVADQTGAPAADVIRPCQFDEGAPATQTKTLAPGPPAVTETFVIGHFSGNLGCQINAPASVLTRTTYFFRWILSVAGQQVGPQTTTPGIPTPPCNNCVG